MWLCMWLVLSVIAPPSMLLEAMSLLYQNKQLTQYNAFTLKALFLVVLFFTFRGTIYMLCSPI